MARLLQRYLSLDGRLARLPFFIRSIYLGIGTAAVVVMTVPLFAGGGVWWWLGLGVVVASLAFFALSSVSLIVRRLHDLGLSGYHAIWVGAAEAGWSVLSSAPPRVMFLSLPLGAISLWLLLWPGNRDANRFGQSAA